MSVRRPTYPATSELQAGHEYTCSKKTVIQRPTRWLLPSFLKANTKEYYLDQEEIDTIWQNEVSGRFLLTEKLDKPPFKLSFGASRTIMQLIAYLTKPQAIVIPQHPSAARRKRWAYIIPILNNNEKAKTMTDGGKSTGYSYEDIELFYERVTKYVII
ncbi:hypothetical protein BGX38DRAFT_418435 [Terfezia claveryi]|nr:hypothetical protein BGX38DRAFT_418435 [Terfezia claveryi]